jgi:hypothetical protein
MLARQLHEVSDYGRNGAEYAAIVRNWAQARGQAARTDYQ